MAKNYPYLVPMLGKHLPIFAAIALGLHSMRSFMEHGTVRSIQFVKDGKLEFVVSGSPLVSTVSSATRVTP